MDCNEALFCDLGIDNFATFVSTKLGVRPFLIKGKVLKSINQHHNKQVAELRSKGHHSHIRIKSTKLTINYTRQAAWSSTSAWFMIWGALSLV